MNHSKLRAAIQGGLLVLVALMPFHAFLSVWLGHLTGHQAVIQAWKEVLLLALAGGTVALAWRDSSVRDRLRSWPVLLVGAFGLIGLIVTLVTRPPLTAVAFGLKTDLEFLLALVLALLVTDTKFVRRLTWAVIIPACVVVGFGLLQISVLPANFLTQFGYGPGTVPPYLMLDPAVQSLRFASTLGGPNQLGTYLLLPLALAAVWAFRRRQWWWLALVAGGLVVIIHTYSRSAWVGALAAAVAVILVLVPGRWRAWTVAGLGVAGFAAAYAADRLIGHGGNLQYYLLHSSLLWHTARGSDYQHLLSLQEGLNSSLSQPGGHGLGTAGPATFHAGTTVIIENNYLQYAYETGVAGVAVFIGLVANLAVGLLRRARVHDLSAAALAGLIGVSVTALVLPAWTDSTTALVMWTTLGAVAGLHPGDTGRV